ncbi:hypothetical protein ACJZ2D_006352 [Fusarium nematophilum]
MALPIAEDEFHRIIQSHQARLRSVPMDKLHIGKAFSFEKPHRCAHCAPLVLEPCEYEADGGEKTIFNLNTTLMGAIQMSREGCDFFEWLSNRYLDWVALETRKGLSRSSKVPMDFSYGKDQLHIVLPVFPPGPVCNWNPRLLLNCPGKATSPERLLGPLSGSFLCAKKDNLSADYVSFRPHELDLESQITARFARERLEECRKTHDVCRLDPGKPHVGAEVLDTPDLPTRLLEILPPDADIVRLVGLAELPAPDISDIAKTGFVALSYCWGGDQPVKSTQKTAQALKNGIATSSLPQTLRDAIRYTSVLRIKHIWIDALCIRQDDDHDKALEIARMPLYYHRNTVTIVASSAETCRSGFLGKKKLEFQTGPFEIAMRTPKGVGSMIWYDPEPEPPQPTTFRAWTLQESLLSRRLLIFGSARLTWCCTVADSGCGGPQATMTTRSVERAPEPLVAHIYPLCILKGFPVRRQWNRVVLEYTRRKLTNPSDKLLAVAAAAETIHVDSRVRGQEDTAYLAGLITIADEPDDVSDALGWMTNNPADATRIQTYTAPSWSWACIDGEIIPDPEGWYMGAPVRPAIAPPPTEHRFRLIQHEITPVVSAAPYGAVSGGFLKIRGPVWPLDAFQGVPLAVQRFGDDERSAPRGGCLLTIYPDTREDLELFESKATPKVFLLELNFTPGNKSSSGLLLRPGSDTPPTFRRVGMFFYEVNRKKEDRVFQNVLCAPNVQREIILL